MEDRLRELCDYRDDYGRPIKGKLKNLALQLKGDGFQVVIQYFFVQKWGIVEGADPVDCLRRALAMEPDMEPFPASTPDFVAAVDPEPENVTVAKPKVPNAAPIGDLSDLLG